jgi:hypothetical protein
MSAIPRSTRLSDGPLSARSSQNQKFGFPSRRQGFRHVSAIQGGASGLESLAGGSIVLGGRLWSILTGWFEQHTQVAV